MSASILAVVTFFVSLIFNLADAGTAFKIALLSLIGWLFLFTCGYLIHNPVSLHNRETHAKAEKDHWIFGIAGLVAIGVIASVLTALTMWVWVAREPKFHSADPGAFNAKLEQQRQEIEALRSRIPDETSLKVRLARAADEYEDFWRKYPKGPTCNQTSDMTPEQQRKVIEPCSQYFMRRDADYQRLMAPRIMEMVQEVKAKGIDVLNIENCASAGFCGIPLSVQLRAFSLRLDAHDNVKGLGCISSGVS